MCGYFCERLNDLCRFGNVSVVCVVGELFRCCQCGVIRYRIWSDERYGFLVGVHRLADHPDAFEGCPQSDIDKPNSRLS